MASQLMPFNEVQFDRCMLWFSSTHNCGLTQYEAVKLHVLSDLAHLLEHGMPIIGGKLEAWPEGPVVKQAYSRMRARGHRFNEGVEDGLFSISRAFENIFCFSAKPNAVPERDEFSQSELDAMEAAWRILKVDRSSWAAWEAYFHEPAVSHWGSVWADAIGSSQKEIHWEAVIDAYDAAHPGQNHDHVKQLIAMGV